MERENLECHRALKIPEILQHIIGFLHFKDLNSCRQVSKFWELTSRNLWSASGTVQFSRDSQLSGFLNFVEETQAENLYSSFAFEGSCDSERCDKLWVRCGTHVKHLRLCQYPFSESDNTQWRNQLFGSTPNLSSLELLDPVGLYLNSFLSEPQQLVEPEFGENWNLRRLEIISSDCVTALGTTWMELFCHFPGVQTLVLGDLPKALDSIFDSIHLIRRNDPNKLKLKGFSIDAISLTYNIVDSKLLQVLTDPELHLEHVAIGLNGDNSQYLLRSILKSHGNSLRSLELENQFYGKGLWDPLPHFNQQGVNFNHLTKIVLQTWVFSSLGFLRFTPNLTSLRMSGCHGENFGIVADTKPEDMQNVRLERCRELFFNTDLKTEVQSLIKWLPFIERLTIPMNNETFALVCQHWCRLTSLEIPESSVDECGITGLDNEHVKLINENEGKYELGRPTVPRANITCLKDLQCLTMELDEIDENDGLSLGYAAAKFGINELKNLRVLSLEGFEVTDHFWNAFEGSCDVQVQ